LPPLASLPFLPGALPFLSPPFFLDGLSSSSSSSASGSGSSTTKRYLHLGQSILRPISPGSRIGTIASQLGHCCLKLVPVAMYELPHSVLSGGPYLQRGTESRLIIADGHGWMQRAKPRLARICWRHSVPRTVLRAELALAEYNFYGARVLTRP